MVVLGVPVLNRYDLLSNLVNSANGSDLIPDKIIVIDNGGKFRDYIKQVPPNLYLISKGDVGVAGAWNLIIKNSNTTEDVVIISNDDIEFSSNTTTRFANSTSEFTSCRLISGINKFSLFSITSSCISKAGLFDEEFHPAYFEDNSYQRKMMLGGVVEGVVDTDIKHLGSQSIKAMNSLELRTHHTNFEKNKSLYISMWGGLPGSEVYTSKWNR